MATDTVKQDVRNECNSLSMKLAQLQAMLFITYGADQGGFIDMSDEMKDYYLSACSDMADECRALSETISTTVHRQTCDTAPAA